MITQESTISFNELGIEMMKIASKVHVLSLALEQEEGSEIAIKCSSVLKEIDEQLQTLTTVVVEDKIKDIKQ